MLSAAAVEVGADEVEEAVEAVVGVDLAVVALADWQKAKQPIWDGTGMINSYVSISLLQGRRLCGKEQIS
jgi:hypothetical protein